MDEKQKIRKMAIFGLKCVNILEVRGATRISCKKNSRGVTFFRVFSTEQCVLSENGRHFSFLQTAFGLKNGFRLHYEMDISSSLKKGLIFLNESFDIKR